MAASIQRALDAPLPDELESEVVAVNDGSSDSTPQILDELAAACPGRVRVFHHKVNSGKGSAIRTAIVYRDHFAFELVGQWGIQVGCGWTQPRTPLRCKQGTRMESRRFGANYGLSRTRKPPALP